MDYPFGTVIHYHVVRIETEPMQGHQRLLLRQVYPPVVEPGELESLGHSGLPPGFIDIAMPPIEKVMGVGESVEEFIWYPAPTGTPSEIALRVNQRGPWIPVMHDFMKDIFEHNPGGTTPASVGFPVDESFA